jgi:hypothetical protein
VSTGQSKRARRTRPTAHLEQPLRRPESGAFGRDALHGKVGSAGGCELTDMGTLKQLDSFYFTRFNFRLRIATAYRSIASFCDC